MWAARLPERLNFVPCLIIFVWPQSGTRFMSPNICVTSVWNAVHVSLLLTRILNWMPDFCKPCAFLVYFITVCTKPPFTSLSDARARACVCVCVCARACVCVCVCIHTYRFQNFFYVVRHLDSIASYLPTGLHLGFFRSWPSLYSPSRFSSVFLMLHFVSVSTSMLFWVIFLLPFSEHGRTM